MTTTNGDPVTTHDARLRTMTVEVRVIRIGEKQMTLAVFRQLPSMKLVTLHWETVDDPIVLRDVYGYTTTYPHRKTKIADYDTIEDLVTVWGWVNYHGPDCEHITGEHLHLVFAREGHLYREIVRMYEPDLFIDDEPRSEYRSFFERMYDLGQLFIAV